MKKKAQVRMTETIAIMFIFFVLVLFGLLFFFQFQKASLKEEKQELLASRAMDTTLKALFMPELQCTNGLAEQEINCFEVAKLNNAEVIQDSIDEYYFDMLSFARITIQEIYPDEESWEIYDKPKDEYTQIEPTYFVVALRDDLSGKKSGFEPYKYGYMKVEVYS
ncbi:hypothetical protein HOI26_01255 [Candidatus Woesearchaeota archaeon]|nr:hypothetical protein [Candidatus Woesearchaeota archaeon]MBT5739702.1 hypothetical protein [Candidatus Woesearchaeota archaeon]